MSADADQVPLLGLEYGVIGAVRTLLGEARLLLGGVEGGSAVGRGARRRRWRAPAQGSTSKKRR